MQVHYFYRPPYTVRSKIIAQDGDYESYRVKMDQLYQRLESSLFKNYTGKLYVARIIDKVDLSVYEHDSDSATVTLLARKTKVLWNYMPLEEN